MNIERPPNVDAPRFNDWMFQLWKLVSAPVSGINETNHAALGNLNSDLYTHLTALQALGLTTGLNTGLHFHDSDRARANHTGTQAASTISDLATVLTEAVRLPVYTVATLPAAPIQGDRALCTNLLGPVFLAAAVGGGAVIGPVFFNGAAWIVG